MGRTKLVWNQKAFRELRLDQGVAADIERRTRAIKEAAGEGFEMGSSPGTNRYRGNVVTATHRAMKDQAKNNTLQRALDAGRG